MFKENVVNYNVFEEEEDNVFGTVNKYPPRGSTPV